MRLLPASFSLLIVVFSKHMIVSNWGNSLSAPWKDNCFSTSTWNNARKFGVAAYDVIRQVPLPGDSSSGSRPQLSSWKIIGNLITTKGSMSCKCFVLFRQKPSEPMFIARLLELIYTWICYLYGIVSISQQNNVKKRSTLRGARAQDVPL